MLKRFWYLETGKKQEKLVLEKLIRNVLIKKKPAQRCDGIYKGLYIGGVKTMMYPFMPIIFEVQYAD